MTLWPSCAFAFAALREGAAGGAPLAALFPRLLLLLPFVFVLLGSSLSCCVCCVVFLGLSIFFVWVELAKVPQPWLFVVMQLLARTLQLQYLRLQFLLVRKLPGLRLSQ